MTDEEKIAEFMARKGVTRIAEGEATMTGRDHYMAARGREYGENALIAHRRLAAVDHCGREIWVNGLGERIS